jgi:hypothetical protein
VLLEAEASRISSQSAHEGGKVVSLTYRPQKISLVLVSITG